MRITIVLLLLSLVICACAYDNIKSSDKDKALSYKAKKEKALKEHKKDDEGVEFKELEEIENEAGVAVDEEEEDVEEEPPKKKIPAKKQKINKDKKEKSKKTKKEPEITESLKDEIPDDDDENVYKACTDDEHELCHCDGEEMNCSKIVMDSEEPHLMTADLVIEKKGFKPVIANFSENGITRLKKGKILVGYEKYVSVLDMSFNQVRFIDSDAFLPFTNLSKLDLSHNNLQNIKKPVFDAVKNTLHRLDIGYNRLKTIPDDFFDGLTNLKVLVLDGNPITSFNKQMFKGLNSLEELSLDACKIEDLPADIFEYLPKLVGVSLRENPLDEIPAAVANWKPLKDVDMSATNLTEIRDHAFAGHSDLEEIILEQMPYLSVVRDCGFCGLPKLKILLLNDNRQLMEIHPNAFGYLKAEPGHKATAVTEFAIHNSNLSTISEHLLDYDKLESFKLGGNPWTCNCDTQFLMEEKFDFKADSVAPKCQSPPDFADKHLATVRVTDACESARFLGRSGRFSSVLGLALLAGFLSIGAYYMVSSGKLRTIVNRVRQEPEVSYTNLTAAAASEELAMEADFQPRPAEV
ncbi:unnamed protein product [Caenorhabditis brenneri]